MKKKNKPVIELDLRKYSPKNFQLYQLLSVMKFTELQEYQDLELDDIDTDIDIDINELEKELAEIDAAEKEKSSISQNITFYI